MAQNKLWQKIQWTDASGAYKDSWLHLLTPAAMLLETRPERKEVIRMRPEKTIRAGAIEASIWLNEAENGQFKTVSLSRNYKDKEGNWKNSGILRANDIPKAMLVLNKAYEYLAISESEA